jgi:hypothetical protein
MRICTLLFVALSSIASAQSEPELKSADLKKISKSTGAWIDALIDNNPSKASDAMVALEEQVTKLNKKKRNALSYVYDWEIALHNSRKYATSGAAVKKGRVNDIDFAAAPYSVYLPKKYDPKKVNYPCIVLLGAIDADQIEALPAEVLDNAIIIRPDISSMSDDLVLTTEAAMALMMPVGQASQIYHLDRMRLFLVGTDELGSHLAAQWGAVMPHLFAGVSTIVDSKSKIAAADNLALVTNELSSSLAEATEWCLAQERCNPYPLEFEFEIPFAQQSRVFWIHPIKFDSPEDGPFTGELAKIKVSVDRATNTISIDATKIDRIKIYLNDVIVDLNKPVIIKRNGVDYTYQASRSVGTMLQVFKHSLDGAVFPAIIQEVDIPQAESTEE